MEDNCEKRKKNVFFFVVVVDVDVHYNGVGAHTKSILKCTLSQFLCAGFIKQL